MANLRLYIFLMCVLPLLSSGSEIPEAVLPAGVGVNIHFVTGHEKDLDLIAGAGFKFVRMDFAWGGIETRKGEYDWSGYEELLASLEKRGLRAILILDYSNPLYEETVTSPNPITGAPQKATASPQHPASIAAFARWAAAAAKHFQGRHVLWEIWNEPNGNFWSPKPDAQQYSTLAVAACKAIREAEPQATIIGPASSGFPWEFLETFLKSGVLEYLDAVSVHPYRDPHSPPETAASDYQKLRAMIERYAPTPRKDPIPILSGEWGYSTHKGGVSLETQAAFAARQQLSNLLNGVPLSIWYDWKNDGPDPNENEHNFGTVLPDLQPKPAYVAIQTLTRELSGYRIVRRISLPGDKDYVLLCTSRAGGQKLAAWTLAGPHEVSLDINLMGDNNFKAVNRNGETSTPKVDSGRLVLELKSAPQYVTLGKAVLK
ncbi:MAG: cellulase family glycosylhydrolase [Limisphaerales bacterium]